MACSLYTPWLLISVALILIAAGDVLFSNISLLAEFDLSTTAFPLYDAGNLCFVGALVWYNTFGGLRPEQGFKVPPGKKQVELHKVVNRRQARIAGCQ